MPCLALSNDYNICLDRASVAIAAALAVAAISANTMGLFSGNQMPVEGKTLLLTGATEGLGRAAAIQFAAKGANIVVTARNEANLAECIQDMKAAAKSPSQQFHAVPADISVQGYAADLLSKVLALTNGRLDVVWCVAGISIPHLIADDAFLPAMRRTMDVNFWGATELAHNVFKEWTKLPPPGAGKQPIKHIVFTCSVAAFFSIAGYGTYNSTKWGLRGLADTMAQEALLYPDTPVAVHVVFPGNIDSPGMQRENKTKPAITVEIEKDEAHQSPEDVARKAIAGLERGDHFVTVSLLGSLFRFGVMGISVRNNWVVDTLGLWLLAPIWSLIAQLVVFSQIRGFAKKNGHPSTWPKKGGEA